LWWARQFAFNLKAGRYYNGVSSVAIEAYCPVHGWGKVHGDSCERCYEAVYEYQQEGGDMVDIDCPVYDPEVLNVLFSPFWVTLVEFVALHGRGHEHFQLLFDMVASLIAAKTGIPLERIRGIMEEHLNE